MNFRRFPQTVILTGAGKEQRDSAADLLAEASVCKTENACGECRACKKAREHSHTEIIYIEKEKDKKIITVSAARNIRSAAYVKPAEGNKKIFIIREAEALGEEAQNALLKILEEPPDFDRFILCTENVSALLPTIRSRAVIWSVFGTVSPDFSDKAGALAKKTALAAVSGEEAELVYLIPLYEKDRATALKALELFKIILRDAAAVKFGTPLISGQEESADICSSFTPQKIIHLTELCENARQKIESNVKIGIAAASLFCGISAMQNK